MKKLIILFNVCLLVVLFFLVSYKESFAQSTSDGHAPNTQAVVDACLARGSLPAICAGEGTTYLQENGFPDSSFNCNTTECTITCSNGVHITVPIPPTPTATAPVCDTSLNGTACTINGITRTCSSVLGCGKAYPKQYNDKCECVTNTSAAPVDAPECDASQPGLICSPLATSTPPPTTTSTPPITTGTPPVTTGTPPVITTGTPPPVNTPPATPTPPPFSEEACQCVGLDTTALSPGSPFTVTAKGKVTGTDIPKAKLISFKFFLYKGTDTSSSILQSEVPTSVSTSSDGNTVNYTALWNSTFPTDVTPSVTYRIQAQKKCVPKSTAMVDTVNTALPQSVVLGASTEQGFFEKIISFIKGLFGIQEKAAKITPTPTQTSENTNSTSVSSTGDGRKGIQLDNFYPGEITEQSCSFIKFKFASKN